LRQYQKTIHTVKFSFRMGVAIMVFLLAHCVAKFVMAFVCEDSLWDLTLFPKDKGLDWKGCVDLTMYLEH